MRQIGFSRRHLLALVLAGGSVLGPRAAFAHSTRAGEISIGHAWGLPTTDGTTKVMVPLLNGSGAPDALLRVTSPLASGIVLRQGETALQRLEIAPRRPVAMRPDGLHLFVSGLREPLRHGDRLPLRLVFERAGEVPFEAWIEPTPYAPPPA
jgi:copper(I)-binding protein